MTTILFFIVGFLIQAVALKLSLSVLGQASAQNKFGTALGVVAILNIAMLVISFVPIVGWLVKPLVWLLVIMTVYRIGFVKGVAAAFIQFLIQLALKWLLAIIGFSSAVTLGLI